MRPPEEAADFEWLCELVDQVDGRLAHWAFDELTEPERTLWVIWWLHAEVLNGGFSQYFFNDAGNHAADAAPALRRIGAHRFAAIVTEAIAVFPPPGPSADRAARIEQLGRMSLEPKEWLHALTNRFYDDPAPVERLLAAFARQHESEFLEDAVRY